MKWRVEGEIWTGNLEKVGGRAGGLLTPLRQGFGGQAPEPLPDLSSEARQSEGGGLGVSSQDVVPVSERLEFV
jgi:hypothetical protein